MSEVPVVVMECTDSESRPVLGPAVAVKSVTVTPPSILRRKVSMNASCSSDASSDSSHSRVSSGKFSRRSVTPKRSAVGLRSGCAKSVAKLEKVESDGLMEVSPDG
ncbi:hypothetical protein Tco_1338369 [Tanacetum coccineum]